MAVERNHLDPRPFADALRAAITARGLPLDRIRDRLLRRGYSVTSATLSYWQSGRSRPERRESLAALGYLEEVLDVPAGSLAALLGPPRPRGRWLWRAEDSPEMQRHWADPGPVADALGGVDTRWDDRLTRISQHDEVIVGPRREEVSFRSRQVLRAEVDGPDRWVVILHLDEHDRALPRLNGLRHCRVGRVVDRPGAGLRIAELLFDRPLGRGETIITEHELVNGLPCPLATNYDRKFRLPVREYALEITFDPAALPARCVQYSRVDGAAEQSRVVPMAGNSVHGVALSFGPGYYGFRWDWALNG